MTNEEKAVYGAPASADSPALPGWPAKDVERFEADKKAWRASAAARHREAQSKWATEDPDRKRQADARGNKRRKIPADVKSLERANKKAARKLARLTPPNTDAEAPWLSRITLRRTADGSLIPVPCLHNAVLFIENESPRTPWENAAGKIRCGEREWTALDTIETNVWLQGPDRKCFVGHGITVRAIQVVAHRRRRESAPVLPAV